VFSNLITYGLQKSAFTAILGACLLVSACTVPPAQHTGVYDPYEASNRQMHAFNKKLDTKLVGPTAKGYGAIIPPFVDRRISNFASFMGLPRQAVNNLLQGDIPGLSETVLRFATNGITLGLFDPATDFGIPDNDADFGQTLAYHGFPQGFYHEWPLLGPSTERDTAGFIIDTVLDPVNFILPSSTTGMGTTFSILDRLGDRNDFSDIIEQTLYNSEDSYLTARSLYLQNRAFKLNKGVNEDTLEDPFSDF